MDEMSDLQMAPVSSESSGQSGSPSQSQALGTQAFRSRQWNSPMSHKMASKMARAKERGEEKGKCSMRWWLAKMRITWLGGCTFEHGHRCCSWNLWLTKVGGLPCESAAPASWLRRFLLQKTGCPLCPIVNISAAVIFFISAVCTFNGRASGTWWKTSRLKSHHSPSV